MAQITNWIRERNLQAFLQVLAWKTEYDFDDGDWQAIQLGVAGTDGDASPPRWFAYEFAGANHARFEFARDSGTSVIQVRLDVPADLEPALAMALDLMNQYALTRD